ncbi:MAG: hypothetical protein O7D32_08560, partial [bacterium]|nr:hypothetical protein [bacterium]
MATTPAYRRWFCLTPIGLGLVVSGYLLARTFTLLADHATDAIDVCSAIFRTGCDKTLLSNTSWQLGIPLAGWGIVFYGTLAGLLVLGWSVGGGFQRTAALGALLLTAAGAIASATLAGVIIAGAAPFCPFCMVIHLINLGLVAAVWWLNGLTVREVWDSFRIAGAYWLKGDTEDAQGARWSIVGFVSTALLAVVLYQWVLVQTERRISAASFFDPQQVLATYSSTPRQPVTIDSTDPRLGTADAAVQLAVFSSFQCPGCQEFAT